MKKLFIVAAAVAISVVTNASTVTWGAKDATVIDDEKITTGTFYLMYASDATAVDFSKFATMEEFNADSLATVGLDKTFDQFAYSSSTFQKKNNAITPTSTGVDPATGLTVYEVLISSAGDYVAYGSSTMNLAAAAGMNQSKTLSAFTYVPKASGGGDIPEPTSGLLLLVGGAMLALRRRRA